MNVGMNGYSAYADVVPILVKETTYNAGTEGIAEVSKENSVSDDVNKKWRNSINVSDDYINYNVTKEHDKRWECINSFIGGKISAEEFKSQMADFIRKEYDAYYTSGRIESNSKTFLEGSYMEISIQIVQSALNENSCEGEKVNRSYGTAEEQKDCYYAYYNAKYYYLSEDAKRITGECLDELAADREIGNLQKEKYLAEHLPVSCDFNTHWSGCAYRANKSKMYNPDSEPPANFSFFYRESYINLSKVPNRYDIETHRFLLVNGVSTEKTTVFQAMEKTKSFYGYADLQKFISSYFADGKKLLEEIPYLKNFRIYSLLQVI